MNGFLFIPELLECRAVVAADLRTQGYDLAGESAPLQCVISCDSVA